MSACPTAMTPPGYLPSRQKDRFDALMQELAVSSPPAGIDADMVARYLIAEGNYLRTTERLSRALSSGNVTDAEKYAAIQNRFFNQCRAMATDLGLTAARRRAAPAPIDQDTEGGDPLYGD